MKKTILNLLIILTSYTLHSGAPAIPESIIPPDFIVQNTSCKLCLFVSTRPSHMARHMRTHTGERPYQCEWNEDGERCDYAAGARHTLNKHMRTHTREKPYACNMIIGGKECKQRFTQSGTCKRHQKAHTEGKKHACEQCGKRFQQASNLKQHQFSHSEERPYVCIPCNKDFKSPKTLKEHITTDSHKQATTEKLLLADPKQQPTIIPSMLPALLSPNAEDRRTSETEIEKIIDEVINTMGSKP